MNIIDILALLFIAFFVWKGVKLGLIEAVGGIAGVFIGAFTATKYYPLVAAMIDNLTFGHEVLANIIAFILIFALINRLLAFLFWVAGRMFNILAFIPFLKSFNSFLGGLFGVLESLIFLGALLVFISLWPTPDAWQNATSQAKIYPWLVKAGSIVQPFLPEKVDLPVGLDDIPRMTGLDKIADPVKNLINSTFKK